VCPEKYPANQIARTLSKIKLKKSIFTVLREENIGDTELVSR